MSQATLTAEQLKQVEEWREKYLAVGRQTGPCDREAAEGYIKEAYQERGLEPPKQIIWVPSVMAGCTEAARLANNGQEPTAAQIREQVSQACYGQHDVYWLSYYAFARDVLGLTSEANPTPQLKVAEHVCWWWPFENICVVSERPTKLCIDDEGRLHCEDGKALEFSDGWGFSSWHGTRIPDEWVTTDKNELDPALALTWPQIEQRRCAAEIIGWGKVLERVKYKVIDNNPDPHVGMLISVDLPDAPDSRFLKALCGTGRTIALPVPNNMTTAEEANCWTYNIDVKAFRESEGRT